MALCQKLSTANRQVISKTFSHFFLCQAVLVPQKSNSVSDIHLFTINIYLFITQSSVSLASSRRLPRHSLLNALLQRRFSFLFMSESHVNPSAHVLFFDALSKRASVIPAPDDQPLSLDLLAEHCLFTIKSALASIDSMQLEASIYAFILKTPLTRPPKALVAIDLLSWAASKIAETILSSSDRESVTVYADAVNETISLSRNGTLSEIDYFVQVGYKYALHIEPDDPFTLPDHLRCVRRDTAQSWKHTDYRNHGTVLSWSHPPIDIMLQLHRFLQHQNWASFLELSSVNKVWKGLAEPLRWQQITVSSDENLKEILNSVPASTLSLVQRINIKDKAQTKQLLTLLSRCSRLNAIMLESNGMMAGMTQLRLALRPPFQQLIVDDTFMDLIEKSFVGFCDLGLDLVNKTDAHYPQFVDDIYPGFADDDDFSAEEVGKPTREEMQRVLNEKFAHISRLQVLKSGQRDQKELQNFAITVYKALPQLETIEGLIWSFYTDPRTTSIASVSDLNLFLDFVSLPWITLTTLKFDILFYPGYERDRSIFLYPDHFQGANERISFLLRQKAGCLPTVKTIDFYLNCARVITICYGSLPSWRCFQISKI
ncbi:hypothetical protein BC829DRAFT_22372 [Chytridium lagenaria]|nr:hypothetical protein BC829DRAFT_22372 [Chytridium lagenaria]